MMMATSNNMLKTMLIVITCMAACNAATVAFAQTEPNWNRSVEAIAVLPDGTGGHEITVIVSAQAENLQTFGDLSALVMLSINGSVVQTQVHQITSFPPGFPAGCPPCLSFQPCVCCGDICGCGGFVAPAPNTWNQILAPGDVISVVVVPAPGSLPEDDLSDNQLSVTFQGQPIYWERRVVSASVKKEPGSPGPGFSSVEVEWTPVFFSVLHDVDLSMVITLHVNGVFVGGIDACANNPVIASPDHPCLVSCGDLNANCGTMSCAGNNKPLACKLVDAGDPCGCSLSTPSITVIDGLALAPGDTVTVTLEPLHRGLPNLAGLPPLHVKTFVVPSPCPADINGDGAVGVADLLQLLSCWGPVVPGCQGADLTGDNVVGVADLLQLLAAWGACP